MTERNDVSAIPGYRGESTGPPPTFRPTLTRLWTSDFKTSVRFGSVIRRKKDPAHATPWVHEWPCGPPFPCTDHFGNTFHADFADLVSLHPCRALDLVGETARLPGGTYDSGLLPRQFDIGFPNQPRFFFGNLPDAVDTRIMLVVRCFGNFVPGFDTVRIIMNGDEVGELFDRDGVNGINEETFRLNEDDFTALLENGNLEIEFRTDQNPDSGTGVETWLECQLVYVIADNIITQFANAEQCYQHRAAGWVMGGDGFARPYLLQQPDKFEDVLICWGGAYNVPADGGGGGSEMGSPGMAVIVFPMQTPRALPFAFGSYPIICGVPT
jgi:hypothetical protein